jgi:alpha-galactosidase
VFVFRLPGGEPSRRIRLHALDPTASYDVHWSDRDHDEARMGAALMDDGLTVELPEEGSELVVVRRRSA